MAVNRIAISPDDVKKTATEMAADIIRYRDSYENVYKAAEVMLDHWKGRDVTIFYDKLLGYKPALQKMESVIEEYIAYLNMAEQKHRQVLNDNAALAQNLPG